jgi:hypothetical protein
MTGPFAPKILAPPNPEAGVFRLAGARLDLKAQKSRPRPRGRTFPLPHASMAFKAL